MGEKQRKKKGAPEGNFLLLRKDFARFFSNRKFLFTTFAIDGILLQKVRRRCWKHFFSSIQQLDTTTK